MLVGDLGFAILGPPSKKEVQIDLRTTIPHSVLTIPLKKKKAGIV